MIGGPVVVLIGVIFLIILLATGLGQLLIAAIYIAGVVAFNAACLAFYLVEKIIRGAAAGWAAAAGLLARRRRDRAARN